MTTAKRPGKRLQITRRLTMKCAEAVWAADYPAFLWPSACDAERARCVKAAVAVLNVVRVTVREVAAKKGKRRG